MSDSLWSHGLQGAMLPSPSLSSGVSLNSCPLSQWCYPTISSSVSLFSTCLQSFPISGLFPVNQLFTPGSQSTGDPASVSVIPMNSQGWFPLGLTGLMSLLSKGFSRIFSKTTIWKDQFFASGGQSIRAAASASVLPMNIQDWLPLGLTGLISLQSKGFSRVPPAP